mmetsp:Transcript_123972/g.241543  ORF Transcript_123972/g.241543 Transcript_123972/m.241543 type:complete len:202 (+) Transcript_123972:678-1283(+)
MAATSKLPFRERMPWSTFGEFSVACSASSLFLNQALGSSNHALNAFCFSETSFVIFAFNDCCFSVTSRATFENSPLASLTCPSALCHTGPNASRRLVMTCLPCKSGPGSVVSSSPEIFRLISPTCSLMTTAEFLGLTFSQNRPTKSRGPSSRTGSTVFPLPMLSFCISFIIMVMVSCKSLLSACSASDSTSSSASISVNCS